MKNMMSLLSAKEKPLCRIEIVKEGYVLSFFTYSVAARNAVVTNQKKKYKYGFIPVGTKGTVVRKWGRKYFFPDQEQEGLEAFTPLGNSMVLLPMRRLAGLYKIINEDPELEYKRLK